MSRSSVPFGAYEVAPNPRSIPTVRWPCHRRVSISILIIYFYFYYYYFSPSHKIFHLFQNTFIFIQYQYQYQYLSTSNKPTNLPTSKTFNFSPKTITLLYSSISLHQLARLQLSSPTFFSPLHPSDLSQYFPYSIRFKPPKYAIFFSTPGPLPTKNTNEDPLFPRFL